MICSLSTLREKLDGAAFIQLLVRVQNNVKPDLKKFMYVNGDFGVYYLFRFLIIRIGYLSVRF